SLVTCFGSVEFLGGRALGSVHLASVRQMLGVPVSDARDRAAQLRQSGAIEWARAGTAPLFALHRDQIRAIFQEASRPGNKSGPNMILSRQQLKCERLPAASAHRAPACRSTLR